MKYKKKKKKPLAVKVVASYGLFLEAALEAGGEKNERGSMDHHYTRALGTT